VGFGEVILFWGWGLTQVVVSWVAWEGKVLLFFQVGRWVFLFSKELFFWWCGMGGWRKGVGVLFPCHFFFPKYGDLMKIFSQENIL
jgi:hypothetical protein